MGVTRFKKSAKQRVDAAPEPAGVVETDVEVPGWWLSGPSAQTAEEEEEEEEEEDDDDADFLAATHDLVESYRREAIQEGIRPGRPEDVARLLVRVYEARFGVVPKGLRAVVEDVRDEGTLTSWLLLAGTRNASDVAAAIRSFRAR